MNKTALLKILVEEPLRDLVKERAKAQGISYAEYIRRLLLKDLNVKAVKEFKLIDTTEYYI